MDEVNDAPAIPVDSSAESMDPVTGEPSMASGEGSLSTELSPAQINAILARPATPQSLGKDAPPNGILKDEDLKSLTQEYERQQKYGDRPLSAAAAALASGLSFSLSDRALEKTGLVDKETLKGLAEYNPGADIMGQVTGAIVPAILTGGESVPESIVAGTAKAALKTGAKFTATGLMDAASRATENAALKAMGTAAAESGSKKLVAEIVKKSVAKGLGSAVEGAAWNANQLLREDAIGNADLNAENLLSYAGEGALLGGGLGASLVPGGAILKGIGGGLSKGLAKVGEKVFDPVRDSARLMDLSASQVAKFQEKNPQFLERLPDWLRTTGGLKLTDTAESLATKVGKIEEGAITRIDNTIANLDKKVFEQSGQGIAPSIYNDVATNLERDFVEPYKGMRSLEPQTSKAKQLIEDFRAKANDARLELRGLTFQEVRDMRINMDKLAKGVYKSAEPTEGAQAAYAARKAFNDVLKDTAQKVDPALAREFSAANLDYHMATTLHPKLAAKAEKSTDFVSFKNLLLGGVLEHLDPGLGLTVAAAKQLMNSDLKRKMVILSQVEKATQNAATKTSESVANFFNKASRPAKLASTGILVRSELAKKNGTGDAPKNKVDAFRNIQNNVVALAADPTKMQDRMAKSTSVLSYGAPQTAASMGNTMLKAVQFLARVAPKDARDSAYDIYEPKYQPSSQELSKFERHMQIVEHPLSALKDLENGTLTRDHVEALKAVYPNLYNEMRVQALKQAESTTELGYSKRIQLGILLDIPTDSSLSPTFILQMQKNFVPPEQQQGNGDIGANGTTPQVQPTAGGAAKLDSASRQRTPTQKVAAGDGA